MNPLSNGLSHDVLQQDAQQQDEHLCKHGGIAQTSEDVLLSGHWWPLFVVKTSEAYTQKNGLAKRLR